MKRLIVINFVVSVFVFSACVQKAEKQIGFSTLKTEKTRKEVPEEYLELIEKVSPFFEKIDKSKPGEWLSQNEENGQTFEDFINGEPTLPTDKRQTIYIQPLGKFTKKQRRIIKQTEEYLAVFYNLPTKLLITKDFEHPMSLENKRTHPQLDIKQVRTGFILDELLQPNLPDDAAALIAFTSIDLYPNKNYNFVFGQASLIGRVGVWSLFRLQRNADYKLFLKRTLKIAAHETGHMFSFQHCTAFSCAMNGSNHIVESDKRPLDFCPEDTAKIVWMTEADAKERYQNLSNFCLKNGLVEEGKLFKQKSGV